MDSSDEKSRPRGLGAFTRRIRAAVGAEPVASEFATAPRNDRDEVVHDRALPERYLVKDDQDGRYLTSVESSNIRVRIERGQTVSKASARKAEAGSIFLDGAAQGEPFTDASKRVFNLDHHEGCVRSFTLATCEQAMVMILKGLDLAGEQWNVTANDPDLDTVLAIWLLLNHRRLAGDETLRGRVMPLVRLQGAIDAHGLELAELTGFPEELQASTLAIIEALRENEVEIKRSGSWDEIDLLEFTASALQPIDELFYDADDLQGSHEVEELGRVKITPKRLAIACRSDTGIYEVEAILKEIHGDRLGLILLATGDGSFTLRQTDPFLGDNLEELYPRLNLLDPRAGKDQQWGGSDEIGGSPRGAGTGLSVNEILAVCRWVFNPPGGVRRMKSVLAAVSTAAVVLAAATFATGAFKVGAFATPRIDHLASGTAALLALALLLSWFARLRQPGLFGSGPPRAIGALLLVAPALLAALGGGLWAPLHFAFSGVSFETGGWTLAASAVAGIVGFELLIHGVCHGLMAEAYPVMLWTDRRFLSIPNAISALISAGAVAVLWLPPLWLGRGPAALALWVTSALAIGLMCGFAREHSGSVWLAILLHLTSAAAAWTALTVLVGS